jgi:hypothetical protein
MIFRRDGVMGTEYIVPSIIITFIIIFFLWHEHRKTEEHTKIYKEIQNKYNYLNSMYYPLKIKYDELNFKYETIKLFISGEISEEAVLLLYGLWYYTDEAEELTEEPSKFIILPEFFNNHIEKFNIERKKLWNIYKKLEKLGYINLGSESGKLNWFEITDKAKLYFEYADLKHIGDLKR